MSHNTGGHAANLAVIRCNSLGAVGLGRVSAGGTCAQGGLQGAQHSNQAVSWPRLERVSVEDV